MIFETATTPAQKETRRILQLLNPGFDGKIKVFADPGAKTGGLNIGGLQVTGGEDRVYLFVKEGGKAFKVKKRIIQGEFPGALFRLPADARTVPGREDQMG